LEALPVGAEAGEGFAAFAASAGATALPDLLEAAAAWLSRRGGAEPSTRGELVALATEALRAEPVREDALRAIGTLLREGRLLRGQGGRLQAGTATRFDPGRPAG
jgi:hypothetical protein